MKKLLNTIYIIMQGILSILTHTSQPHVTHPRSQNLASAAQAPKSAAHPNFLPLKNAKAPKYLILLNPINYISSVWANYLKSRKREIKHVR